MSAILGSIARSAFGIAEAAAQVAEIHRLSRRPLPSSLDGLSDTQAAHSTDKKTEKHAFLVGIVEGIKTQMKNGLPISLDFSTATGIVDALQNAKGVGMDDRLLLLETIITLMSRLPKNGKLANKLLDAVITLFYKDLPHPPATYMGKKYSYRAADGGHNNVLFPDMGRAGTPYARSVPASHPVPASCLPDPELVFDTLLRRDGKPNPHPSGVSSLLFAFASIIIHSLFNTDRDDTNINKTSSYLDLSPLYGNNQKEQDSVRQKDGFGKLYPDIFAQAGLALMPPSVPALLVVFARNHNFVASKIYQINERSTFKDPLQLNDQQRLDQDDEIFNKARLVNCGAFMSVIVGDYVGAILGFFRDGCDFHLNPLQPIRSGTHEFVQRGEGNVVSVEFNLLYHWHSSISEPEERWTEEMVRKYLPAEEKDKDIDKVTKADLGRVLVGQLPTGDPRGWTFGGLTRLPSGELPTAGIAKILQDATATVSSAFQARGTPAVMRMVEVMSLEQARKWGVCTMNEFRKFIGLKPFESFEEWNSDKEIAKAAMHLYEHIDNLELYPGLQAEEAKKPGLGAGLCAGYTVTRGLLADAVSVTRGDRFLTTDFTPFNLTSWGYQDCARDEKNGSNGGMLGKLLFRTLGEYYTAGSVYAHFPFVVPSTMEHYLIQQGVAHKYNFKRPRPVHEPIPVNTFEGVKQVLGDMRTFRTTYSQSMKDLTKGYGFFLAFDEPSKHRAERVMMYRALYSPGALEHYAHFYGSTTRRLIDLKSYESRKGVKNIDIVRDVINLVPVHWVCEEVAGIPLKSDLAPHGIHTEQEVYQMMVVVFTFIFLNVDPVHSWMLRENAVKVATIVQGYITARLRKVAAGNSLFSISGLRDSVTHWLTGQEDHSDAFLRSLLLHGAGNHSIDELSYNVFGLIIASVANYAQAMTHIVDFYLDGARAKECKHIKSLVMDPDSDELLAGYAREAMRLYPQAPGIFRDVHIDAEIFEGHDQPSIKVKKGDRLWVSLTKANLDADAFPNPTDVDPTRDPQQYSSYGRSEHSCLGELFCNKTMPQVMRAVFGLKNVRRAPGQSGRLKRYTQDLHGTKQHMYINAKGMVTPWPASMVIQYDS